jgi:hypothetical protein
MPEQLSRDMKQLLQIFNARKVQYLVIGAHALSVYAEPRATKDLDIWVNPAPENASRVFRALKRFGAPLQRTTEQFFTERNTFMVIGVIPNRIDILKSIPGVEFEECWQARRTLDIGGVKAHFPSPEHLLAAKLAAARPQDLVDAAKLKKAIKLQRKQAGTKGRASEQPSPSPEKKTGHRKGLKRGRGPEMGG